MRLKQNICYLHYRMKLALCKCQTWWENFVVIGMARVRNTCVILHTLEVCTTKEGKKERACRSMLHKLCCCVWYSRTLHDQWLQNSAALIRPIGSGVVWWRSPHEKSAGRERERKERKERKRKERRRTRERGEKKKGKGRKRGEKEEKGRGEQEGKMCCGCETPPLNC